MERILRTIRFARTLASYIWWRTGRTGDTAIYGHEARRKAIRSHCAGHSKGKRKPVKNWYRFGLRKKVRPTRSFLRRCERTAVSLRRYDELASRQHLMGQKLPGGVTLESFISVCVNIAVWIDNCTEGDQILLSDSGCLERGSGLILIYRDDEPFLVNDGVVLNHEIDNWDQMKLVLDMVLEAMGEKPFTEINRMDQYILGLTYIAIYQTPHIKFRTPA